MPADGCRGTDVAVAAPEEAPGDLPMADAEPAAMDARLLAERRESLAEPADSRAALYDFRAALAGSQEHLAVELFRSGVLEQALGSGSLALLDVVPDRQVSVPSHDSLELSVAQQHQAGVPHRDSLEHLVVEQARLDAALHLGFPARWVALPEPLGVRHLRLRATGRLALRAGALVPGLEARRGPPSLEVARVEQKPALRQLDDL